MGRGEYGRSQGHRVGASLPSPIDAFRAGVSSLRGHELTDEEIRAATAAGNLAVAPLMEERAKMLSAWPATKPLSRDQMTTIMNATLKVAREAESQLVAMIDKVPSHWEDHLKMAGGLTQLRQALVEALKYAMLVPQVTSPTVLPGFREWIDHLLSRSESAVQAMASVGTILPDWLRMRDILETLHRGAIAAINAILALGKAAVDAVEHLPDILKWGGIAVLVLGSGYIVSKLSSAKGA